MVYLKELIKFDSGSAQFRIKETLDRNAPLYKFYSQTDMLDGLSGLNSESDNKHIRTYDEVKTTSVGDIIFSLISGTTSIVSEQQSNYIYTQNYIKLTPNGKIDSKYLVYLINQSKDIRKQFSLGIQGSQVFKYTSKQLKELQVSEFPPLEKQKIIGNIYFKQIRLQSLKERVAKLETELLLEKLQKGEI